MANAGKPTYIPIHYQPFLSDDKVLTMDAEQIGAFFLLILVAWQGTPPCSFADDPAKIPLWARVKPARWTKIGPLVMVCFRLDNGRWYHDRLAQEYAKSLKRMEIARNNGKAGGRPHKEPSGLTGNNPAGSDPVSETKPSGLTNRDYEIGRLGDGEYKTNPRHPPVSVQIPKADDDHDEPSFVIRSIRKATGRNIGANDRHKLAEVEAEMTGLDPPIIDGIQRTWPEVFEKAVTFALGSSGNHSPAPLGRYAMGVAIGSRTTKLWPGVAVMAPRLKPDKPKGAFAE